MGYEGCERFTENTNPLTRKHVFFEYLNDKTVQIQVSREMCNIRGLSKIPWSSSISQLSNV